MIATHLTYRTGSELCSVVLMYKFCIATEIILKNRSVSHFMGISTDVVFSIFSCGTVSFIACICEKHHSLRIVDSSSVGTLRSETVFKIHRQRSLQ
jgi:hypothetical protein